MLGWDAPDRDVFRKVLAHPKLVPYYHTMMGEGYRMDHLPLLIQQAPGADGFVFHGGKMNDDGTWCEELAYQWHGGKMHNRRVRPVYSRTSRCLLTYVPCLLTCVPVSTHVRPDFYARTSRCLLTYVPVSTHLRVFIRRTT